MKDEYAGDRKVKITFRVSVDEECLLNERCQGVKRSLYIRAVLFSYPRPRPRPVIPQVNRAIYVALNRIGTNLNQQTKAINEALGMGFNPALGNAYFENLAALQELVQQVQRELSCLNNQVQEEE